MMQKIAKGSHPVYLGNPQVDQLMAIVMALAGEVSVLRERVDTLERLLEAKSVMAQADIEAYEPDPQAEAERSQVRSEFIDRVLRVLQEEQPPDQR